MNPEHFKQVNRVTTKGDRVNARKAVIQRLIAGGTSRAVAIQKAKKIIK